MLSEEILVDPTAQNSASGASPSKTTWRPKLASEQPLSDNIPTSDTFKVAEGSPRIWAATLAELTEVYVELLEAVNGVCAPTAHVNNPVLLVGNPDTSYIFARWVNDEMLACQMMQDFSVKQIKAKKAGSSDVSPISTNDISSSCLEVVSYPKEVAVLSNAYKRGLPVLVITSCDSKLVASQEDHVSRQIFLGFFTLTHFEAEHATVSLPPSTDAKWKNPPSNGRVRWSFYLSWTPGGESFMPTLQWVEEYPWWKAASMSEIKNKTNPYVEVENDQTDRPITGQQLPSYIFSPERAARTLEIRWRGWHCDSCGMINIRKSLKAEECACCKVTRPEPLLIAISALHARTEDKEWLRFERPLPLLSAGISQTDSMFNDGMVAFDYSSRWYTVTHVSTGNHGPLQREASELFESIQRECPLNRQGKDLIWSYALRLPDERGANASVFAYMPNAIFQCRSLMVHEGRTYGRKSSMFVSLLKIIMTSGKHDLIFEHHSQDEVKPSILLCLGSRAAVTITPFDTNTTERTTKFRNSSPYHLSSDSGNPILLQNEEAPPRHFTSPSFVRIILLHGDMLILNGPKIQCKIELQGFLSMVVTATY